jgi:NitT/TauT family transport system permease protein
MVSCRQSARHCPSLRNRVLRSRVSRAPAWQILFKIRFPCALPSLFAGMKVAISFALVGAIVGEFVAGGNGLGFQILVSQGQFDTPRVFVSLLLLGLMGTILFYSIDFAERALLPWHVSQRTQAGGIGH